MSNILPQQQNANIDTLGTSEPKRKYKKRLSVDEIHEQAAAERAERIRIKRADFTRLTRRKNLRATSGSN